MSRSSRKPKHQKERLTIRRERWQQRRTQFLVLAVAVLAGAVALMLVQMLLNNPNAYL
jgi:hypothetical protein